MTDESLWDAAALARFLGYSEATVVSLASKRPESLPPRVAGLKLQRWVPAICRAWVEQQSQPLPNPRRPGRPANPPPEVSPASSRGP